MAEMLEARVAGLTEQVAALSASLEALENALETRLGWLERCSDRPHLEIYQVSSDLHRELNDVRAELSKLRQEAMRISQGAAPQISSCGRHRW
jgi:prefoldin subunit 5